MNSQTIASNSIYIAEQVSKKENILVTGTVIVDGTVEGNITGYVILVGASGVIKGNIAVTEAIIHGTIFGNIKVKQLLSVHPTGRVVGDVSYRELQFEKGAIISGIFSSHDSGFDGIEVP